MTKKSVPPVDDYSAYIGIGHNQPSDIEELVNLAREQAAAEIKVELKENELKLAKEELKQIAEKKLPQLMDKLGTATYETTDGISIEVAEEIRASIPEENRPKAWDWIEENGFGALIKSGVVVPYRRTEIEEANLLVDKLRAEGRAANLIRKVEPMTLTSFIKEQLELGKDIPLDIFKVFRQRVSKVEIKK